MAGLGEMARALGLFDVGSAKALVTLGVALLILCSTALCINGDQNESSAYQNNLILNVYIDDAGKALVTGYADSINGLSFLEASQYSYDNDSRQLYALTDSLTFKTGNDWEAKLFSEGDYGEYHSTFYLPTAVVLSKINSSRGLEYLVSASNESFTVDIHGYDIKDPDVSIRYQLPLVNAAAEGRPGTSDQIMASGLIILVLISAVAVIWLKRRWVPSLGLDLRGKGTSSPKVPGPGSPEVHGDSSLSEGTAVESAAVAPEAEPVIVIPASATPVTAMPATASTEHSSSDENACLEPECTTLSQSALGQPDQKPLDAGAGYQAYDVDDISKEISSSPESAEDSGLGDEPNYGINLHEGLSESLLKTQETPQEKNSAQENRGIEITSEMAAVMETLTSRERTVLTALIDHKGRMTQADIRYETRIPKSSLTGILLSLERRKLVIKKEWGRTNIIELSEWFLSKKERS